MLPRGSPGVEVVHLDAGHAGNEPGVLAVEIDAAFAVPVPELDALGGRGERAAHKVGLEAHDAVGRHRAASIAQQVGRLGIRLKADAGLVHQRQCTIDQPLRDRRGQRLYGAVGPACRPTSSGGASATTRRGRLVMRASRSIGGFPSAPACCTIIQDPTAYRHRGHAGHGSGQGRNENRIALRAAVRNCPDRTGHRQEPLLSGAALHRHGPRPAEHACGDARHEGRGRLGRRLHRILLDTPDVRRSAATRSPRCGTTATCATSRRWPIRCTHMARSPASSCGTAAVSSRISRRASRASACARCPGATDPIQSQRMDRSDIRAFRRWHLAAARRARQAGFDIIYVYPTHGYLVSEFLSRSLNDRSDEYGGSLENRSRLMRELIEETREAVGDRCAVAVRFSADGHGDDHLSAREAHDVIGTARAPARPVGRRGRPTTTARRWRPRASSRRPRSKDKVAYVRRADRQAGRRRRPLHLAGHDAAPDPPRRARSHRRRAPLDRRSFPADQDPRGARSTTSASASAATSATRTTTGVAPLRCTQNPTMGEEWRKRLASRNACRRRRRDGADRRRRSGRPRGRARARQARALPSTLADAAGEAGGRVTRESRLPGLAEWARVRDYRARPDRRMPNVALYLGSRMRRADVREFGADHVIIATGARWRRDGVGRWHARPIGISRRATGCYTPDDMMDGALPGGPGRGVRRRSLITWVRCSPCCWRGAARRSRYVTTEVAPAQWSQYTGEQDRTQRQLLELGVEIIAATRPLDAFDGECRSAHCVYTGRPRAARGAAGAVTSREPDDALYRELAGEDGAESARAGPAHRRLPAAGLDRARRVRGPQGGAASSARPCPPLVRRDRTLV